jgi:hypothetical protein
MFNKLGKLVSLHREAIIQKSTATQVLIRMNRLQSCYNAKICDLRSIPLNINVPPNGTNCLVTTCKIGERTLVNNNTHSKIKFQPSYILDDLLPNSPDCSAKS